MRVYYLVIFITVFACNNSKKKAEKVVSIGETKFFVGTYTQNDSKGIYSYSLLSDGTLKNNGLVAEATNPSFLAKTKDSKYLVAVNETGGEQNEGKVESYEILDGKLQFISKSSSGGDYPCFVNINSEGFVCVANYGSGTIGLLKVDKKGSLSELLDVQKHEGKGNSVRQEGPHAHSVYLRENNEIVSVDLGTNEVWFSKLDRDSLKLTLNTEKLMLPEGAGPRHMDFHPNGKWAYVINELTSSISQLEINNLGYTLTGKSISTLPNDFEGHNSCADIHVSNDGAFVYASNRGHNSVAIYKVNSENGSLILFGYESTRGETPRNFALSPDNDFLLVANQNTNTLVSFKRNSATGTLSFVSQIEAPTPVCILF